MDYIFVSINFFNDVIIRFSLPKLIWTRRGLKSDFLNIHNIKYTILEEILSQYVESGYTLQDTKVRSNLIKYLELLNYQLDSFNIKNLLTDKGDAFNYDKNYSSEISKLLSNNFKDKLIINAIKISTTKKINHSSEILKFYAN